MLKKFFDNRWVNIVTLVGICVISIQCILLPKLGVLNWLSNYTVQIMLILFGVGLSFYAIRQDRLMFASFGCCAALCFFLKTSSHIGVTYMKTNDNPEIVIALSSLNAEKIEWDTFFQQLYAEHPDLVILQEVNFNMVPLIDGRLTPEYPYHSYAMLKNDFWGVAVYSKHPFSGLDTLYQGQFPLYSGKVDLPGYEEDVCFISTYLLPPFNEKRETQKFRNRLASISKIINSNDESSLVLGNFNVAGWHDEILDFREINGLSDSRRGYMPAYNDFFGYPVNHIFYTEKISCVGLKIIKNADSHHVGLIGRYQMDINI